MVRLKDKVATKVRHTAKTISVTYHDTEIVKVEFGKQITLRSGGWETATTKRRMNQAAAEFDLDFQVWQELRKWYVAWKGKTIEFEDGMTLTI